MSSIQKLRAATSRKDVASLLGVKLGMLTYALYNPDEKSRYTRFEIPKRHGGTREILAPQKQLKLLQSRLSDLLQDCAVELNTTRGIIEDQTRPGIAHGFKRHHTTMTNGRAHVGRRYVFNVDLHDFFGSINFGRVRGFFLKDRGFQLHTDVATTLAQIACFDNKLPQGSPCSPAISNLIAHPLDILLVKLATRSGLTYTRYADDLTFSTNKKTFPSNVASQETPHQWVPGNELERIIAHSGFSLNATKTRMQYRDSRQEVTGLIVNQKVNVPATYRYTTRAMVTTLLRTGKFEFVNKKLDASTGTETENRLAGRRQQLLGRLSYIDQVDRFNRKLRIDNNLTPFDTHGRVELFRRFLYFDIFYAANQPIILCEGKTDNIYLKCAIRALASRNATLVEPGTPPKLKIKFFKYAETRIGQITDLTGGVAGICKLLKKYHDDVTRSFKAPPSNFPVIVVIDNDSGAHSIYEAIAGITKKPKPAGRASFIHVTHNLYVVPTPLGAGNTPTSIEDFFEPSVLKEELNGKTFNRANKHDEPDKFYGKAAFARDVIAKNANTIKFDKFQEILDRIIEAMEHYKSKCKASTTSAK